MLIYTMSLSARRAWIEIKALQGLFFMVWSLSARRAWIEIKGALLASVSSSGSLSARRAWIEISVLCCDSIDEHCRSPQGERG